MSTTPLKPQNGPSLQIFLSVIILFSMLCFPSFSKSEDVEIIPPFLPLFKKTTISSFVQEEPSKTPLKVPEIGLKFLKKSSQETLQIPTSKRFPKIALYERETAWWLVIDTLYDTTCLKEISKDILPYFELISTLEGTVLKFKLNPLYTLTLKKDLEGWVIGFQLLSEKKIIPETPFLSLIPEFIEDSDLTFILEGQGQKISFIDQDTKEYITVIPLAEGSQKSLQIYSTVKILPSLQGLVLSSPSPELTLESTEKTLTFKKFFSPLSGQDYALKRNRYRPSRLFLFENPLQATTFEFRKSSLLHLLRDQLSKDLISPARFDLVKLYLSQGLYTEAYGELKILKEDDPVYFNQFPCSLYEGLLLGLTGRSAQALKLFEERVSQEEPELNLWRGMFSIDNSQPYLGLYYLFTNLDEILSYPISIQNMICLKAAQVALELNYPAEIFLNLLKFEQLTSLQKEEFKLLQAVQKLKKTSLTETLIDFETLKKSSHPKVRLYALYYLTQHPSESLQHLQDNIALLEKNRFIWRRDFLEVKILNHLSSLYLQANQPEQALTLLRQILLYYPHSKEAIVAQTAAPQIIFEFLTEKKIFSPFQAVTFYKEYKDLAPQEEDRQIKIKEILADHYLELNLLEKAADILKNLIEKKQTSPEIAARLSIKLAQAQIQEDKNEEALQTLQNINTMPHLPAEISLQQRQLQAQILTHQHKYEAALSLLEKDEVLEVLYQKVDIAFRAENWPQAVISLLKIIDQKEQKKEVTPDLILNLAVAYFHGGQTQELIDLKKKYQNLMLKSPLAAAFSVLTTGPSMTKIMPKELLQQLDEAGKFNQHLTQYQKGLKKSS